MTNMETGPEPLSARAMKNALLTGRLRAGMAALLAAQRQYVDAVHFDGIAPVGHRARALKLLTAADKQREDALRAALAAWAEVIHEEAEHE